MPILTENEKKYFDHIGLKDFTEEPTLSALMTIVKHHLLKFNYQNTDLYFADTKIPTKEKVPALDVDTLIAQMVTEKRPGFCFQNAELLANILNKLGFKLERHLARVINRPLSQVTQEEVDKCFFTHELLIVTIEGKKYIVDTAFAQNSLREPFELKLGTQYNADNNYRLTEIDKNNWRLDLDTPNGWLCLHQFSIAPRSQPEINEACSNLFSNKKSIPICNDFLVLASVTEKKRKRLVFFTDGGSSFKSFGKDSTKERDITSADEFIQLAEKKFGVTFKSEQAVKAAFKPKPS